MAEASRRDASRVGERDHALLSHGLFLALCCRLQYIHLVSVALQVLTTNS